MNELLIRTGQVVEEDAPFVILDLGTTGPSNEFIIFFFPLRVTTFQWSSLAVLVAGLVVGLVSDTGLLTHLLTGTQWGVAFEKDGLTVRLQSCPNHLQREHLDGVHWYSTLMVIGFFPSVATKSKLLIQSSVASTSMHILA